MRAMRLIVISMVGSALGVLACAMPAFGQAQSQDDLQPGVNTSAMPPQPAAAPAAASPGSAGKPAGKPPAGPAASTKAGAPATDKVARAGKGGNRLELDTTKVTGNKELPRVMYVVPWKHSDLGDLTGKPANSLVDEVLQPVDRDVFNREERYYHTVAAEKSPAAPAAAAPAGH
jgi:hypothetical protein